MAAPRATQWIALRNLSRAGCQQQVRNLHMTGPATYASPILSRERPVLNLPRDIAGLRAECKRRNLEHTGTQRDLIARIHANELTSSRAFSTVGIPGRRPQVNEEVASSATQPVRQFNTSRSLKAVGDSSTIDFAYLPDVEQSLASDTFAQIRVPILPDNYTVDRVAFHAKEADEVVMKPEISTMSADAVFLPMSELHDGHAMNIDFHAMSESLATNLRRMKVPVEQQAGMVKQLWNDMVDDVLGVGARKPLTP